MAVILMLLIVESGMMFIQSLMKIYQSESYYVETDTRVQ